MAFFDDVLAATGAIHDVLLGETFLIKPRCGKPGDPDAKRIADPDRPEKTFTGVWSDPHAIVRPLNRTGHPAGEGASFNDDKPRVDFEISALPYRVAIGDLIQRTRTGTWYAAGAPADDGWSRAEVALTAVKGRA